MIAVMCNFLLHRTLKPRKKKTVFMMQLHFHRIFCEIVITAYVEFQKAVIFSKKKNGFKNQRIPLKHVELHLSGLSFETDSRSKIEILTTFSEKTLLLKFYRLCTKGASINYVSKILPIFDPSSPLRQQVYYISLCNSISIWLPPPSPAYVVYGGPLIESGFLVFSFIQF